MFVALVRRPEAGPTLMITEMWLIFSRKSVIIAPGFRYTTNLRDG